MNTVQKSVLRSTICDDKLWFNTENDINIFKNIWKFFTLLYPTKAKALQDRSGGNNSSPVDEFESPDVLQLSGLSPLTADHEKEKDVARYQKEKRWKRERERKEQEPLLKLLSAAYRELSDAGIQCTNVSHIEFRYCKA